MNKNKKWICKRCKRVFKYESGLKRHIKTSSQCQPIPKNQKRKLSICPICKKRFYYWQKANIHARREKHWGCYAID
jgi:hypothetical protein